jgi:hypothetical protein
MDPPTCCIVLTMAEVMPVSVAMKKYAVMAS